LLAYKYAKTSTNSFRGLFTALMLQALSQNFYVCGSTLTDDLKAKHIIINKIEDYPLLIGSKYVQSFIGTTYKDIRKLLLQGEKYYFPVHLVKLLVYMLFSKNAINAI
jgi:hypothetical protein